MAFRRLSSDPDLFLVHNGQPPGYIDAVKKEQSSADRLTNPLLGRWMDLQPDYTECSLGWKAHHIREIGIQRHEDPAILNSEAQDLFVGRSRKANLQDRNSIVPLCS